MKYLIITILASQLLFNDNNYCVRNSKKVVECSVTSSGTVEMSNGETFTATLTVTGPCDASLAQKMRDAIKSLRDSFK